jgi:RimJ/RimL family protein N-acetyltransferase
VDAQGAVEIGYGFAPADWGQGYATEAVRALTAHFLQESGVRTVTAQTAVANPASRRVLEKCGFRQTGTAWDEEDGDLLTWAVTPATLTNGYSIE